MATIDAKAGAVNKITGRLVAKVRFADFHGAGAVVLDVRMGDPLIVSIPESFLEKHELGEMIDLELQALQLVRPLSIDRSESPANFEMSPDARYDKFTEEMKAFVSGFIKAVDSRMRAFGQAIDKLREDFGKAPPAGNFVKPIIEVDAHSAGAAAVGGPAPGTQDTGETHAPPNNGPIPPGPDLPGEKVGETAAPPAGNALRADWGARNVGGTAVDKQKE